MLCMVLTCLILVGMVTAISLSLKRLGSGSSDVTCHACVSECVSPNPKPGVGLAATVAG